MRRSPRSQTTLMLALLLGVWIVPVLPPQDRNNHGKAGKIACSVEEREARLHRMRTTQQDRRAAETEEEREARLTTQCDRRAAETEAEREALLQRDRERHREQQGANSQLPLLHQQSVQNKMLKFHEHMASLAVLRCTTCLEQFSGLQLCSQSTECLRCSRDKHTPKLYSSANNMHPGSVPPELQVCDLHVEPSICVVVYMLKHQCVC